MVNRELGHLVSSSWMTRGRSADRKRKLAQVMVVITNLYSQRLVPGAVRHAWMLISAHLMRCLWSGVLYCVLLSERNEGQLGASPCLMYSWSNLKNSLMSGQRGRVHCHLLRYPA